MASFFSVEDDETCRAMLYHIQHRQNKYLFDWKIFHVYASLLLNNASHFILITPFYFYFDKIGLSRRGRES